MDTTTAPAQTAPPAIGPAGCYEHPRDAGFCPAHMGRLIAGATEPVCMDRAAFARMDLDTWRSGFLSAIRYRDGWTIGDPDGLARSYRDAIRQARRVLRAAGIPIPARRRFGKAA